MHIVTYLGELLGSAPDGCRAQLLPRHRGLLRKDGDHWVGVEAERFCSAQHQLRLERQSVLGRVRMRLE